MLGLGERRRDHGRFLGLRGVGSRDRLVGAGREDAERFIEEVRGDDPDIASYLRIEERELEAGGRN